jgi:hypothetical protein
MGRKADRARKRVAKLKGYSREEAQEYVDRIKKRCGLAPPSHIIAQCLKNLIKKGKPHNDEAVADWALRIHQNNLDRKREQQKEREPQNDRRSDTDEPRGKSNRSSGLSQARRDAIADSIVSDKWTIEEAKNRRPAISPKVFFYRKPDGRLGDWHVG